MSDILLSLSNYFRTNYVITDNNYCRLHYKATVAVLMAFSLLVTAKQYFGDPIDCVLPNAAVGNRMLDTYCWIHKTFSVEHAFRGELGAEIAYPGVAPHRPGESLVYHSYYQWVCFVLILQAAAFYAPRFAWKLVEGNRIRHLSSGLGSPVLDNDSRDRQVGLLVDYMQANRGAHTLYFAALVIVEIVNFVNVLAQICVIDVFLGGEFSRYGWKVLTFTEWHWEARYDPMIRVFPRMAKCTFRMYGTSGDIQKLDAVCVLPINIINEKIYVFLWFWLVILAAVSAGWLVYRAATVCLPPLRYRLLARRARTLHDSVLAGVLDRLKPGDWFIVYQLSKNIDVLHMKCFLERLALELNVPEARKLLEGKER